MKVLMCNKFHWYFAGAETVYFDNIHMLESHGHQVAHFAMQDDRNEPSEWAKYFVRNVNYNNKNCNWLRRLRDAIDLVYSFEAKSKISALADTFKPDIAHLHNIYHQLSPSIIPPLKKRDIPIVLTLHDYKLICPNHSLVANGKICEKCINGGYYHNIFQKCVKQSFAQSVLGAIEMYFHHFAGTYLKNVDIFIAPSEFMRQIMNKGGVPADKIVTLHNSLHPELYEPKFEPGEYFVYVGRLSEEKGVMTLLRAAELLKGVRFVIVGDGLMMEEMRQFASDHGLEKVEFRGRQEPKQVKEILKYARALVLPSEWYENCPMTVLEAFAMGKPAIGARIGGIPELIDDGINGLLFESGDYEDLANKVLSLHQDPKLAENLGIEGRKSLETRFSSEAYYEKLTAIYKKLVPHWIEA